MRKSTVGLVLILTVSALGAAFLGPSSSGRVTPNNWAVEIPAAALASGGDATCREVAAARVLSLVAPYAGGKQCAVTALDLPGPSAGEGGVSASSSTFSNLVIPGAIDAGEPTIAVNPNTNSIFFQEYQRNWRSTDGGNTWAINSVLPLQAGSLDPLMTVDRFTGRVFIVHLYVGCSQMWWSDADGMSLSWRYNPAACGTPGNDHQKLAAGPFRSPLTGGTPAYPNAVYYCYNGIVYGGCSLSPDGGATFDPATLVACGGTLGMPWVANDGTMYVPQNNCGTNGVTFSINNGIGWTARGTGAGNPTGDSLEPDVATTPDGTVYLSGVVSKAGSDEPTAFISTNQGLTWTTKSLVGTTGVKTAVFPVVTTGINGRAAVAFLGTTCTGHPGAVADACTWQLYVSTTLDGGATWDTVQASPVGDPVQRGSICLNGTGCGADRNLLDFIDVTHDNAGNVLVAYADGCVSAACKAANGTPAQSRSAQGTVAKQTSGTTLV